MFGLRHHCMLKMVSTDSMHVTTQYHSQLSDKRCVIKWLVLSLKAFEQKLQDILVQSYKEII